MKVSEKKETNYRIDKQKVCAVITAYNRKELLLECLESLRGQTKPIEAIVVIDNDSKDGTPELLYQNHYISKLPQENFKQFQEQESKIRGLTDGREIAFYYVRMNKNIGAPGGNSEGMHRAYEKGFDWIWVMDDDTIPCADSLEQLLSPNIAYEPYVGALVSVVHDVNGKITYMNKQRNFDYTNGTMVYIQDSEYKKQYSPIDINTFVSFLIKREIVKKVGYPNKDFFIHWDDVDYSLRIRQAGYSIMLISKSVVLHKFVEMREQKQNKKQIIKISELWKYYYAQRNCLYVLLHTNSNILYRFKFILKKIWYTMRSIISNLRYDHPLLRDYIELMAFIDGIRGRLGKNFDPRLFQERYKLQ